MRAAVPGIGRASLPRQESNKCPQLTPRKGPAAGQALSFDRREIDGPLQVLCREKAQPPCFFQHPPPQSSKVSVDRGGAVALDESGPEGLSVLIAQMVPRKVLCSQSEPLVRISHHGLQGHSVVTAETRAQKQPGWTTAGCLAGSPTAVGEKSKWTTWEPGFVGSKSLLAEDSFSVQLVYHGQLHKLLVPKTPRGSSHQPPRYMPGNVREIDPLRDRQPTARGGPSRPRRHSLRCPDRYLRRASCEGPSTLL